MNWRGEIATDIVNAVYGQTKAVVIGTGPRAMMQGYVDRMNEQAPQYEHRIEEVSK